jgi:hypothetical protein
MTTPPNPQTAFPIARYALTARVQQALALPDYAGSLLRGQFGAALRNVACMTRQPTCPGCPLIQSCPYSRIFEAPAPPKGSHALQDFSSIPNPYIIEPPTPGTRVLDANEQFTFHLVLIGHAIEQLPLIIFALQRALAQGLTRQRVPTDLLQVDWVDEQGTPHPIWTIEHPILNPHPGTICQHSRTTEDSKTIAFDTYPTSTTAQKTTEITLHIQTPLRLQHQGQPLGVGELTHHALMYAIIRRTALLMEFHAGLGSWGDAAQHIRNISQTLTDKQNLHWFDWTRYSSRQQQEMPLGGVLGHWTLHGDAATLDQIKPWLWLGQWLHVGKNASMGLGGYRLD